MNLSKRFTGLDTKGELVYQVDTQELVKEFLVANPKADAKTEAEVRVAATKSEVTPRRQMDYQTTKKSHSLSLQIKMLKNTLTFQKKQKLKLAA